MMSVQISLPFRFTAGQVAVEDDPSRQMGDLMTSLAGTAPNERVMLNDYGLTFALFDTTEHAEQEISARLTREAGRWLPTVSGVEVSLLPFDPYQPAMLTFEVSYRVQPPPGAMQGQQMQTAVISISGEVLELSRG